MVSVSVGRGRTAASVALGLASLLLASCGSSSQSGTSADPATLAPASAPLYVGVTIKPAGGAGGQAFTAMKKLTHLAEPYGALAQALLSSSTARPQFKRDIEPWIGAHAGVFITSINAAGLPSSGTSASGLLGGGLTGAISSLGAGTFGTAGDQGAIVLDTSDVGGARSFLNARASEQQAHTASYRGISYQVSSTGAAEGIVGKFAVIGSESGIKSVIETSLGGAAITTATGYETPPASAIGGLYLQPKALASTVHGSSSTIGQDLSLLDHLFAGSQSTSLSVVPTANSISLQGEIHTNGGSTPLLGQESARALGELPGTSWLAAGVGDIGSNLPGALALLQGVASFGSSTVFSSLGGPAIEKIFTVLDSPKARLREGFASWAGPGGMFLSGNGLSNLQAALVIDSKNPSASRAAVGKLANLMRAAGAVVTKTSIPETDAAMNVMLTGFPATISIADGRGKFVVGLGPMSVQGALSPSSTLSTAPSYSSASSTLAGTEPSIIVEFPAMLGFLEGVGLTQSQGLSSLLPYLKSLSTLTAGTSTQSGAEHFRLVLGLA